MEIGEYALLVLTSPTLSGKLRPPTGPIYDRRPDALSEHAEALSAPPRDRAIALRGRPPRRKAFPRRRQLKDPAARARALHFFANHELLAIEILARALLVFPEAPKAWRRETLLTLRDEQIHLALYIERMSELGLNFGDLPLNDYLWRRALDCRRLQDFIAFFSLAVEGANIDHAHDFMQLFRELEDPRSAEVMSRILRDEIEHVRRGLRAYPEPEEGSLYQALCQDLIFPMSPGRCRGPQIHHAGRRAAGFDEAFLHSLEHEKHTMIDGRRPDGRSAHSANSR